MNWFASNIFKSQWFAAQWFSAVTVPVVAPIAMGTGGVGSWGSIRRPRLIQVNLPGLFAGSSRRSNSTPITTRTFQGNKGMFSTPKGGRSRRGRQGTGATRPTTSVNMSGVDARPIAVRHLDHHEGLRTPVPGRQTECSCSRYPVRMRDAYGEFEVIRAYCNIRRGERVVRHLG